MMRKYTATNFLNLPTSSSAQTEFPSEYREHLSLRLARLRIGLEDNPIRTTQPESSRSKASRPSFLIEKTQKEKMTDLKNALKPIDETLKLLNNDFMDTEELLFRLAQQNRRKHMNAQIEAAKKKGTLNEAIKIPNRTINAVENEIKKLEDKKINLKMTPRVKFPINPTRLKFFVKDGLPVKEEPKDGNTFGTSEMSRIPFRMNGFSESRRARRYVLEKAAGCKDNDMTFVIDGTDITVTVSKQRNGSKYKITQSIVLPTDLNLNRIRISRDYAGRIVIEELWNF